MTPAEIVMVELSGSTVPKVAFVATGSNAVASVVDGDVFKAVTICGEVATVEAVVDVAYGIPAPANGPVPPVAITLYGIVAEST
jgi:hypothetical protein